MAPYSKIYIRVILSILVGMCAQMPLKAQQQYTEYELKAGYIINLGKFVTWPKNPATLIVGIIGNDPFGSILEEMARQAASKPGSTRWIIEHYKTVSEVDNCQILFVGKSFAGNVDNLLASTRHRSILTIGDEIGQFCQKGGIVNFLPKGSDKLFEINFRVAYDNCLKPSIELARLCVVIDRSEQKPCN